MTGDRRQSLFGFLRKFSEMHESMLFLLIDQFLGSNEKQTKQISRESEVTIIRRLNIQEDWHDLQCQKAPW